MEKNLKGINKPVSLIEEVFEGHVIFRLSDPESVSKYIFEDINNNVNILPNVSQLISPNNTYIDIPKSVIGQSNIYY